jgi:RNA ligase
MQQYHKIDSIFKRDSTGKQMLFGQYSRPEFEYLKDNEWEFTEKVDGTNIRVMYNGVELTFGGKTDNAQIPASLVNKLRELFSKDKMSEVFPSYWEDGTEMNPQVCLYGEGYGAKIQSGGKYISNGVDFVVFDIQIGKWWLKREDIDDIAKKLSIASVPVIGAGTLDKMVELCKNGFTSSWGDFLAEGIVARPIVELQDRAGHRIITKLKHKDFQC